MNHYIIIILAIAAFGSVFGIAHSQIYSNEQDVTKIIGGADKNCTNVDIIGSAATTPFLLEMVFDPTTSSSITETHIGIAKPVYQKSNQVLVFYTNDTAEYYVTATLDYPQIAKRDVFVRYTSQPDTVIQGDTQYYGSKFCTIFHIVTKAPIHMQTREEILGNDIINIPAMLSGFVNTYQYNTQVEIGTFSSIEVFLLIEIGITVILTLLYIANMGQNRKLKIQSTETRKTVIKMATDTESLVNTINEKVDNALKSMDDKMKMFGGFFEAMKVTLDLTVGERQKLEKTKKDTDEKKTAEKPSYGKKIKNFWEEVRFDIMTLKGIRNAIAGRTDDASKQQLKEIDTEIKKRESREKNTMEDVHVELDAMLEPKEKHEPFNMEKISQYTREELLHYYRLFNDNNDVQNRENLLKIHSELVARDEKIQREKDEPE